MPTGGSGIATYYNATGAGACGFDPTPDDLMVVSMNAVDYGTSEWCGACLEVEGPTGKTITVRVVDECPECPKGNIDLSPQAFAQLQLLEVGGVAVKWHEVACNVTGPIAYHFKDGSNWTRAAIQIRNHRYPIATVEAKDASGTYKNIPRVVHNYFVSTSLGYGPFSLRVTDVHGHQVADDGIQLGDNVTQQGTTQLAACP